MDFNYCFRPYHSCRGISVLPASSLSSRLPAINRFLPRTSLRLTTPFHLQYPKFSIETYAKKKKKKKNTKTTIFEPKPNKEDESLIEEESTNQEEDEDEEEEQVLLEDVLDGA